MRVSPQQDAARAIRERLMLLRIGAQTTISSRGWVSSRGGLWRSCSKSDMVWGGGGRAEQAPPLNARRLAAGLAPREVWCCVRVVRGDKGPVLAWFAFFQWIVDGVLDCLL